MKKTLQLLLALFTFTYASAQTVGDTFTVGDLNYEVTSTSPNEAEVTGFSGTETATLTIPATAEDSSNSTTYNVVAVGVSAFKSSTVITTVSLPSSVTTLESEAFSSISTLTTINLDDVEVLASKVFTGCTSLSDVGSMEKVISIGDYCFNKCTSLSDYKFSTTLTTIGTGSIYHSGGISLPSTGPVKINIPNSVTTIGQLFLGGHGNLTAVQVNWTDPADVAVQSKNFFRWHDIEGGAITLYVPVGTKALYEAAEPWGVNTYTDAGNDSTTQYFNHANIVEGTLPVTGDEYSVGDYNFRVTSDSPAEAVLISSSNAALESIVVPATATYSENGISYSVTAIGSNAFKGNTTITSVSLPSSVTKIGASAFQDATNLATINTENITEIETSGFREADGITTMDLSSLVTTGPNCLSRMDGLTSLDLPAIEELGTYVFVFNNNITSIKLGASATTFYESSFSGLPGLTSLEMAAVTPPTLPIQIQSQNTDLSNVTLIAPTASSATAYSNASGWDDFGTFTETGILSNEFVAESGFNVYPNPTEGVVTIQNVDVVSVSVLDTTGKVVLSATTNTVDVSSLSSGVYLLKVATDNSVYVERIIKK